MVVRATTAGRSAYAVPGDVSHSSGGISSATSSRPETVVIIDKKTDGVGVGISSEHHAAANSRGAVWSTTGGGGGSGATSSSSMMQGPLASGGHYIIPIQGSSMPSSSAGGTSAGGSFINSPSGLTQHHGNFPLPSSAVGAVGTAGSVPLRVMVWQRLSVLVMLLLLQSTSQFVMEAYESLISANIIIPLFLTMLVGAGGNAGNQAAVHSITGLVTGEYKVGHMMQLLRKELIAGLVSSSCLFCIAFVRVYIYYSGEDVQPTPVFTTVFSISLSLFVIVLTSVVLGSMLPFLLASMKINVEHAAPMIQVLMDILGVCISCFTCSLFLPTTASPAGEAPANADGLS